MNYNK